VILRRARIIIAQRIDKERVVAKQKRLTGLLCKAIHLDDAKPRDLRAVLLAPPDESDILAFIEEERRARFVELDMFFGLKTDRKVGIWEQRAKALVAYKFDVDSRDPQWWRRFTCYLLGRYVPGFSLKLPSHKKHGAPLEWNDEQLSQLFADVEFLKKKTGMSARDICKKLPKLRGYARRWGRHEGEALRKQYSRANSYRRGVLFQFVLCGANATIPANGIDHIEAAIERHALKIDPK
jgi:hypothetical protein